MEEKNINQLLLYYTSRSLKDAVQTLYPDPDQELTLEMLQKILILAKKLDEERLYNEYDS